MDKRNVIERRCRRCHRKYYLQRRKHIPLDSIKFCPDCLFEQTYYQIFFSEISTEEIEIPVDDFRVAIDKERRLLNARQKLYYYIRKGNVSDKQKEAVYKGLRIGIKDRNYYRGIKKIRASLKCVKKKADISL